MKGWALLLIIVLLLAGCSSQQLKQEEKTSLGSEQKAEVSNETPNAKNTNNPNATVLFIIAQKDFRDEELLKPKQILEKAGYQVIVASITTDYAIGMLGAIIKPDLAVKDANVNDYGLIVVVGGSGAPELANHPEVLNLLKQAVADNKKIGGICLGPMVLAKAGVLEGKKATVFSTPDSTSALQRGGAILVDNNVVVDSRLVTANGPASAEEFGNALVNLLKG